MIEPLVVARAINDVGSLSLLGILAFRVFVERAVLAEIAQPRHRPTPHGVDRLAAASLALAVIGGLAWLALQTQEMADQPLPAALTSLPVVLQATVFGRISAIRLVLLLVIVLCATVRRVTRESAALLHVQLLACAGAVAAQAWAGHAVAMAGLDGAIMLATQALHLLAAGTWLGGLLPLAMLLRAIEGRRAMLVAAQRFSALGIVCVAILAATAVINAWQLIGSVPALLGTAYGHDCLIKAGLFAAMIGLAALNRLRLTPRLLTRRDAARDLRRSIYAEAALGLVVLLVAAQLASTPPGAHVQPWWPLPRRFSLEALQLPGVGLELLGWGAGVAAGCALAIWAIRWHRFRVAGLVVGLALAAVCLREPAHLLSVEAFPTSFWQSPSGYSAASIARGARAFAANCASCHGVHGQGDGPAGQRLKLPPADLTADHLYDHSDGDIFWWISEGMADGAMPGLASVLDEPTRWSLIDFVHANADGARLAGIVPDNEMRSKRAPSFVAECSDTGPIELAGLRGKAVHLVFAGAAAMTRVKQLEDEATELASVVTVIVSAPAEILRQTRLCGTDDPNARAAYTLFDGRAGEPIDGSEFLIDRFGWIRAAWRPGQSPAWTDQAVLRAKLDDILRTAVTTVAVPHVHHH